MYEKKTNHLNRSALYIFLVSLAFGLASHLAFTVLSIIECFLKEDIILLPRLVWLGLSIANVSLCIVWFCVFLFNQGTLQFDKRLYDYYRYSILLSTANAIFFAGVVIPAATLFNHVNPQRFKDWLQIYYLAAIPFFVAHLWSCVHACRICYDYLAIIATKHIPLGTVPEERP